MIKVIRSESYLQHHGILGQKWGKMNGPPYPLSYKAHSKTEKKLNPKTTIDGDPNTSSKKKGLTDKQKDIIKGMAIGLGIAAVAAAGTIAYTKLSQSSIEKGRGVIKGLLNDNIDISGSFEKTDPPIHTEENIISTAKNLNPLGNIYDGGHENCVPNALAYTLQQMGYKLNTTLESLTSTSKISNIFPGFEVKSVNKPGREIFGHVKGDRMLRMVERELLAYGDDVSGILYGNFDDTEEPHNGHAIAWHVLNGKVHWIDGQGALSSAMNKIPPPSKYRTTDQVSNLMDQFISSSIEFGSLSNLKPDLSGADAQRIFSK